MKPNSSIELPIQSGSPIATQTIDGKEYQLISSINDNASIYNSVPLYNFQLTSQSFSSYGFGLTTNSTIKVKILSMVFRINNNVATTGSTFSFVKVGRVNSDLTLHPNWLDVMYMNSDLRYGDAIDGSRTDYEQNLPIISKLNQNSPTLNSTDIYLFHNYETNAIGTEGNTISYDAFPREETNPGMVFPFTYNLLPNYRSNRTNKAKLVLNPGEGLYAYLSAETSRFPQLDILFTTEPV